MAKKPASTSSRMAADAEEMEILGLEKTAVNFKRCCGPVYVESRLTDAVTNAFPGRLPEFRAV